MDAQRGWTTNGSAFLTVCGRWTGNRSIISSTHLEDPGSAGYG